MLRLQISPVAGESRGYLKISARSHDSIHANVSGPEGVERAERFSGFRGHFSGFRWHSVVIWFEP